MMKIIFLDIDGVLNTKYWYKHMDKSTVKDKYGYAFDPNAVSNLKRIIDETGANIVISSSWKCMGMTELKAMWRDRHLPGKVIGITPDYDMDESLTTDSDTTRLHQIRGLEIKDWLIIHGKHVSGYVIVDDTDSILQEQQRHFIQTDPEVGITPNDALRAIMALNDVKYETITPKRRSEST